MTRQEIICKFKDGDTRFKQSPVVHATVLALEMGAEPIDIISQLTESIEELQIKLSDCMETKPLQYIVKK